MIVVAVAVLALDLDRRGVNRVVGAERAAHLDERADRDGARAGAYEGRVGDVDSPPAHVPVADEAGRVREAVDDAVELEGVLRVLALDFDGVHGAVGAHDALDLDYR